MIEILLGGAFLLIFVLLVLLLVLLPKNQHLNQQMLALQNQLADIQKGQMESANLSLKEQAGFYQRSQAMLNDVHRKLGGLEQASRQIQELGRDIGQLQDILKAPKLRGNLGEYLLEDLLRQVLPERNFQTQYRFRDGTVVDAVVKLGDRLVPIDSKFPLESFQRLLAVEGEAARREEKREFVKVVRKKIDDIAAKYIQESEGTYDFALMYIPAENVFYELIVTDNLKDRRYEISQYAMEKKVVPVSPNSLYAYLMAIALGLKGFKIEQQARVIMGELSRVQGAFSDFYGDFTLVGKHLKNAAGKYDESLKKAERFNDRIGEITGVKRDLTETPDKKKIED
jgi:DNA recombination protein RmuC